MTRAQGAAEGSARGLVAFALMAAGWTLFIADVVRLDMTGLAVLGVVFIVLALYILRVFTREFWNRPPRRPRHPWIATISESHPDALGSLDIREREGGRG